MAPNLIKFGKNTTGIGKRLINPGKHDCFDLEASFPAHVNRLELYKSVKKYEEIQERLTKCDTVRKPSDKVKKLKESSSRNSDFQWF